MNTEQLKTEAEILAIKNQIAGENGIASWYDINVYTRANFVNDVAIRFASQESKRAVDEFKEQLVKKGELDQFLEVNQKLIFTECQKAVNEFKERLNKDIREKSRLLYDASTSSHLIKELVNLIDKL